MKIHRHKNVVSVYHYTHTILSLPCIVIEKCKCSMADMKQHISKFSKSMRESWCKDLTHIIHILHDRYKTAHYNLKPSNILFDENLSLKITDFGKTCIYYEYGELARSFQSPETQYPSFTIIDWFKVDVYMMGNILLDLYGGDDPIKKNLIQKCIHKNPNKRPSAREMRNIFQIHSPVIMYLFYIYKH